MRIHDYIDYWARRTPEAVCATDGSKSVTWAEMRSWTNQIGQWLAAELEPEARFGMLAKNGLEIFALYFGASRAGVVPVPLNTRLAAPEWAFILRDAGAGLVVAEEEFADGIDGIREGILEQCSVIGRPRAGWRDFSADVARQADTPPERIVTADSPVYQMYTSGTTGLPKGAVLTHAAVIANVTQVQTSVGVFRSEALVVMPLFHAGATISAFINAATGTTTRIVRDFDPAEVIRILRDERIEIATFVPAMVQFLLRTPGVADDPYPDLRLVAYGAAPMASEVLRRAIEVFGCGFVQAYGMTELSAGATVLDPEDHVRALKSDPQLLLSCGRPLLGTEVRVVDAGDHDVPTGELGEVIVRGPQVMSRYWNRPEATAEALVGGWMHTGDAGYFDAEGFLYLADRVKDMLVSGGENVYPREIEEVLFALDGIDDAAVIGVPDDRWGEAAMAFVVRAPGCQLDEAVVIAHCRSRLAGFKCPKSVQFINALPRNATGKVLKRDLRAPYWEGRVRRVN